MPDREKVIKDLEEIKEYIRGKVNDLGSRKCRMLDKVDDAIALLKEQEQTIEALKEKLRLLEYGNNDCVQDVLMPAT